MRLAALRLAAEEATLEERTRVSAILQSPEAWLRGHLARHLALATDLPAPDAIEILRAAPAECRAAAEPPGNLANLSVSLVPVAISLH